MESPGAASRDVRRIKNFGDLFMSVSVKSDVKSMAHCLLHGQGIAMELFLRKHLWAVALLFIFLSCLFVARTTNAFIEFAFVPAPESFSPKSTVHAELRVGASINLERLTKLISLVLPGETEVSKQSLFGEPKTPVKTSLQVRLSGRLDPP